ncbi:hypothetical protein EXIGLDRAFT_767370 [Exidia glandulosa HHB12029]|uniref:2'-phosphotransferase n=1 Tax=Exidia glandulosa HHB12029 TaxID=1314781 RepID=A0A165J1S5_EXIGL|nr:hypothetical protein EXIGLDRAFT_767370 [Exidia glandulosa HHB12029]
MPTFEGLVMADWPMPPGSSPEKYGQFVLVSLDPVTAVACLDDDIAKQAAAALPLGKYLAVVVGAGRIPMFNADGWHRLSLEFYLLGQGLPSQGDPAFSFPISPAHEHPLTASLRTCQHLFRGPTSTGPFVVKKQRHEILLQTMTDRAEDTKRRLLENNFHVPTVPWTAVAEDSHSHSLSADSEDSEASAVEEDVRVAALYERIAKVSAYIEVCTDLSSCEDPQSLGDFAMAPRQRGLTIALRSKNNSKIKIWLERAVIREVYNVSATVTRKPRTRAPRSRSSNALVEFSKSVVAVLRHNAAKEGLALRADGFARVDDLLALRRQRFNFVLEQDAAQPNMSVWYIRANHGHTIKTVEVDMEEVTDAARVPGVAVHGTTQAAWPSIATQGLSPMGRQHIHMAQGVGGVGYPKNAAILIFIDIQKVLDAGI